MADHVEPHNGDVNKFFLGALQSLCQPCHDRHKKREELWGYRCHVDADGWPVDPRHPSNRLSQAKSSVMNERGITGQGARTRQLLDLKRR